MKDEQLLELLESQLAQRWSVLCGAVEEHRKRRTEILTGKYRLPQHGGLIDALDENDGRLYAILDSMTDKEASDEHIFG